MEWNKQKIKGLLLVVCGGLRTPLRSSAALREALQDVASRGVALAGLWNGAWFLGDAGLLDGYRCCIHPEHRAALAEIARNSQVTSDSYMVDRDRLTAASPTGAFNLALEWIARRGGRAMIVDEDNEARYLDSEALLLDNVPPYRYLSLVPLDRSSCAK